MVEAPIMKSVRAGATGLIAAFCEEIGLVKLINQALEWDPKQWKISPGVHILALVINTLCGRVPLYRVAEFYKEHDVEGLFGRGVSAEDFNHDALGRALDAFYNANAKTLYSSITLRNLLVSDDPLQFAHGDTTSKVLYGQYDVPSSSDSESSEDQPVNPARGYSKDKRHDLKQIVMGLVTVGRGMPLLGNVNDGNLDDKTWNKNMIDTIVKSLTPEQIRCLVYVADSAFFTEENVKKSHKKGLTFISLVSEKHSLRKECIEQVLQAPMLEYIGRISDKPTASEYKIQEIPVCFHDINLRCTVVYSTHLFDQKKATFERQLQAEHERLQKASTELAKQSYTCQEDAKKAGEDFLKQHRKSLFPLTSRVESLTQPAPRTGRGRPKKTDIPVMQTVYTVHIDIAPVPEDVKTEQEKRMGYFVLATNHMDAKELSSEQILREYKQQSSVELRFKFLKDPMFVDSLFLKTPQRIEALGYVLLIALFIYMTIEERIRTAVVEKNVRIEPVRGWRTQKPTAKQIILMLEHVVAIYWYDKTNGRWHRQIQQNEKARQIYELLGLKPYE